MASCAEPGQRVADPRDAVLHLRGPAARLLPQGDRHGVHEVGAARGHNVGPVGFAAAQRGGEVLERGHDVGGQRLGGGEVDRGREDVVGRLRRVDVVVGVHVRPAAVREGGDHLVGVHVGAGARAGLEDVDGEVVVVLARGDLVGGRGDRVRHGPVEHADVLVDARRGRLDQPQRADLRPLQPAAGDREVLDGPLGLGPPQRFGGHLHLAHRVALDPEAALLAHGHSLLRTRAARRVVWLSAPPARRRRARASRRSGSRPPWRGGCSRARSRRGCPGGTRCRG